jgi:hypothetical protein
VGLYAVRLGRLRVKGERLVEQALRCRNVFRCALTKGIKHSCVLLHEGYQNGRLHGTVLQSSVGETPQATIGASVGRGFREKQWALISNWITPATAHPHTDSNYPQVH